jgi:hypothetical protein
MVLFCVLILFVPRPHFGDAGRGQHFVRSAGVTLRWACWAW